MSFILNFFNKLSILLILIYCQNSISNEANNYKISNNILNDYNKEQVLFGFGLSSPEQQFKIKSSKFSKNDIDTQNILEFKSSNLPEVNLNWLYNNYSFLFHTSIKNLSYNNQRKVTDGSRVGFDFDQKYEIYHFHMKFDRYSGFFSQQNPYSLFFVDHPKIQSSFFSFDGNFEIPFVGNEKSDAIFKNEDSEISFGMGQGASLYYFDLIGSKPLLDIQVATDIGLASHSKLISIQQWGLSLNYFNFKFLLPENNFFQFYFDGGVGASAYLDKLSYTNSKKYIWGTSLENINFETGFLFNTKSTTTKLFYQTYAKNSSANELHLSQINSGFGFLMISRF